MVSRSLLLHDIYSISWPGLGEGGLFTSQKPRTKKGAKVAVPVACSYVAIGCVCGTDWPDMLGECPVNELYLLLSLFLKGLPPPSAGWLGQTLHVDLWQIVMAHQTQKVKILPGIVAQALIQPSGCGGPWIFMLSRPA